MAFSVDEHCDLPLETLTSEFGCNPYNATEETAIYTHEIPHEDSK